jgi:hypothetical protein
VKNSVSTNLDGNGLPVRQADYILRRIDGLAKTAGNAPDQQGQGKEPMLGRFQLDPIEPIGLEKVAN